MTIQNIHQLGPVALFLGIETETWSLAQFQQAAAAAKALGISSLLIKIADGGKPPWYGSLGGWKAVLSAVNQTGILAIPYTFCYGDLFGALDAEISTLIAAMEYCGLVVADIEATWGGHSDWAQRMSAALGPVPGLFGVTTLADPLPPMQNLGVVLNALKPSTNFWLPQVYSDYLGSVYHAQFDPLQLPYFPVLNLGTDFGSNDVMQIAQNAKSPVIVLWEYQAAIGAYANTVKSLVAQFSQPNVADLKAQIALLSAQNAKLSGALQQILGIAKGIQAF